METPSADSVVAPNPCFPRELVESPAFLLARLGVGLKTRDEKEARQEADRRNLWQTPIHDPQPRSLRRVALLPL